MPRVNSQFIALGASTNRRKPLCLYHMPLFLFGRCPPGAFEGFAGAFEGFGAFAGAFGVFAGAFEGFAGEERAGVPAVVID